MELWIRSQDKENLKRINTGFYLTQGLSNYAKGEVIFIVSGGDELGEYETKERALEVLDEINEIKYYKYMASLDFKAFAESVLKPKPMEEQKKILSMMNTYEMPKE